VHASVVSIVAVENTSDATEPDTPVPYEMTLPPPSVQGLPVGVMLGVGVPVAVAVGVRLPGLDVGEAVVQYAGPSAGARLPSPQRHVKTGTPTLEVARQSDGVRY